MVDLNPADVTAQLSIITFNMFESVTFQELLSLGKNELTKVSKLMKLLLFMRYIQQWFALNEKQLQLILFLNSIKKGGC